MSWEAKQQVMPISSSVNRPALVSKPDESASTVALSATSTPRWLLLPPPCQKPPAARTEWRLGNGELGAAGPALGGLDAQEHLLWKVTACSSPSTLRMSWTRTCSSVRARRPAGVAGGGQLKQRHCAGLELAGLKEELQSTTPESMGTPGGRCGGSPTSPGDGGPRSWRTPSRRAEPRRWSRIGSLPVNWSPRRDQAPRSVHGRSGQVR